MADREEHRERHGERQRPPAEVRSTAELARLRADDAALVDRALDAALDACADAAHRGLAHMTPGLRDRIARTGDDLGRAGLRTASGAVAALAVARAGDDPHAAARAWATACVRLVTTAETR